MKRQKCNKTKLQQNKKTKTLPKVIVELRFREEPTNRSKSTKDDTFYKMRQKWKRHKENGRDTKKKKMKTKKGKN